ncbi:hypothetical protein RCL1_007621 [Eukaryota sp. TZLM3-RCL]
MIEDTNISFDILAPNVTFATMDVCRKVLLTYNASKKAQTLNKPSDSIRLVCTCRAPDCTFKFNARKKKSDSSIVTLIDFSPHTCSIISNVESGRGRKIPPVELIAENTVLRADVLVEPLIKTSSLRTNIQKVLNVKVPEYTARRVKKAIRDSLFGSKLRNFLMLPQYLKSLKEKDRGCHVKLELEETCRFKRVFIANGGSIQGVTYCKPIVALDGTHLHSSGCGVLLTATMFDGKDQLFPVAFAVVAVENQDNWSWFLNEFKQALEGSNLPLLTFISDRQKGLINGVKEIFRESSHAYCLRHLAENLLKFCKKKEAVDLLWTAAKQFTMEDFCQIMDRIRAISAQAYEFLEGVGFHFWSRAHFQGRRHGHLTSNASESLNSWLLGIRGYPIVHMFEAIRKGLMMWFDNRQKEAENLIQTGLAVRPDVWEIMNQNFENGIALEIRSCRRLVEYEAEVIDGDKVFVVKTETGGSCSCGKWQELDYPCPHVCALYHKIGKNIMSGVGTVLLLENYKRTYEAGIMAREDIMLEKFESEIRVTPPVKKRGVGRPKTRRIRVCKKRRNKYKQEWKLVVSAFSEHLESMVESDSEWEETEVEESESDSVASETE